MNIAVKKWRKTQTDLKKIGRGQTPASPGKQVKIPQRQWLKRQPTDNRAILASRFNRFTLVIVLIIEKSHFPCTFVPGSVQVK
ncbi:MAG: hypothetical protein ACLU30_05480 [Odoribacter splanchnicus]